jgi:sugar lactone lactonase YvrE
MWSAPEECAGPANNQGVQLQMKVIRVVPAVALAAALAVPATASAETVSVVASKINNPRQLAIGPDGSLYVAAAGRAGSQCIGRGQDETCFGFTSRVLRIKGAKKSVVAEGFLSAGGRDGSFATGIDGVGVRPDGKVFAVETSATPDQIRSLPRRVRRQAGKLFNVTAGNRRRVADISAFEWARNLDRVRGDRNSNPYAVLALPGRTIVADAGANAILDVRNGRVSLLAVIPRNGRAQPVPTSLALGPDGAIYVGELAEGAGTGKARVWRVPAEGGTPALVASGFTMITGLAFGPDRSMFVTQLTTSLRSQSFRGVVVRVAPDGTRTRLGVGKLVAPAGAAVDAQGRVYVSNFSVAPATTPRSSPFRGGGGQVVRITP